MTEGPLMTLPGTIEPIHSPVPRGGPAAVFRACFVFAACLGSAVGFAADPKPGSIAPKPLSVSEEAALARHLADAFDEGFVMGPRHLQDAEKHLALARRAAPGDPRTEYVYGLVLLKQSQVKSAL